MKDDRYAPPSAQVTDPLAQPAPARDSPALRLATRLLWASLALGVVNAASQWGHMTSIAGMNVVVVILLLTFLIIGVLTYHIGQGRNWARFVLLVLAIIGLPSLLQLPATLARAPIAGSLSLLQTILQFAALLIVFFSSARYAFSKRGNAQ